MPKSQKGGSSDFMHSFYANTVVGGPAAISQATLEVINQAPMFNPLSETTMIPGNATGIVPSGLYLATTQTGGGCGKRHGGSRGGSCGKQHAGGKQQLEDMSTKQLRSACNNHGISCRGPNGGYKHRDTMVKQLAGAFTGLYAPQPGSNQPGFY